MNLENYFKISESLTQGQMARTVGVTPSLVSQWVRRGVQIPPATCVKIELATKGLVTRQELRPDWRSLWPELDGYSQNTAQTHPKAQTPP